jgi:hypothetical protein
MYIQNKVLLHSERICNMHAAKETEGQRDSSRRFMYVQVNSYFRGIRHAFQGLPAVTCPTGIVHIGKCRGCRKLL